MCVVFFSFSFILSLLLVDWSVGSKIVRHYSKVRILGIVSDKCKVVKVSLRYVFRLIQKSKFFLKFSNENLDFSTITKGLSRLSTVYVINNF